VGAAVGFYAALGLVAVLWRLWIDGVWPLAPTGVAPGDAVRPAAALILGAAAGAGIVVGTRWWTRSLASGERLARAMAALLGPLSTRDVVALALASGLAEEAFFRGALQPRVGWLAASLLFGLAHLVPRREWLPWAGFAALAGLLFGALFELSGSLVAPAAAHALVNGVNLHWLARDTGAGRAAVVGGGSAPDANAGSVLDGRDGVDLDGGPER
jgi:membrane protease YdiL (CAAX protease family)